MWPSGWRSTFIDLLLKEAGWRWTRRRTSRSRSPACPTRKGKGFVDYVLWGDDGKPLALVEAKRTKKGAKVGQQQAKLYADCLEAQYGQRPVIFCSNGYEHWIWDDVLYPPRAVQGFYKKAELELIIQRRTSRKPLATAAINAGIVERYYQTRAMRRIGEAFEKDTTAQGAGGDGHRRRQDAHGDRPGRPADARNWAKRVLFLADRVALVNQAVNAFKHHLPDCIAGEPGDRQAHRGPGVRLHLPDDDGADRRRQRRAAPLRRGALRPDRHRRGAPLGLPEVPRHLRATSTACWWA
jgi:type I restriction enzyme R subunit